MQELIKELHKSLDPCKKHSYSSLPLLLPNIFTYLRIVVTMKKVVCKRKQGENRFAESHDGGQQALRGGGDKFSDRSGSRAYPRVAAR